MNDETKKSNGLLIQFPITFAFVLTASDFTLHPSPFTLHHTVPLHANITIAQSMNTNPRTISIFARGVAPFHSP